LCQHFLIFKNRNTIRRSLGHEIPHYVECIFGQLVIRPFPDRWSRRWTARMQRWWSGEQRWADGVGRLQHLTAWCSHLWRVPSSSWSYRAPSCSSTRRNRRPRWTRSDWGSSTAPRHRSPSTNSSAWRADSSDHRAPVKQWWTITQWTI